MTTRGGGTGGRAGSDLEGWVVVVTGASSGIGAATARLLARHGAAVALGARRADRIEALARDVRDAGGRALAVPTDVTRSGDVEALAAAARDAWGRIDVLVANAGVMLLSPLEEVRVGTWERMVDVNVKGVLYAVAAVLPTMLEQGRGHVVTVGSVAGRRPFPGGSVYAATKFAVRALAAGIQLELSSARGIRVTDIQPGVVATELTDHVPDPGVRAAFEARWQERRKLAADDVATAVLHAVSAPAHVNVNEVLLRPTDQDT